VKHVYDVKRYTADPAAIIFLYKKKHIQEVTAVLK